MTRAVWVVPLLLGAALAPSTVTFRDVAGRAGITPVILSGGPKKNYVLEVNGSGACWLDYNGDGWMDLYLVNGATVAQLQGKAEPQTTNHLYRNNGNGTFTDMTAAAGVPGRGWGFGCVAADYDNDGHTDLFITNFGLNILYRNRGDGTFEDVTVKAGVGGGQIWHAGAAFGDYDLDGNLDLFVPGYLDFDVRNPELKTCEYRGLKVHACGPLGYKGAPDTLYHNKGDGTFTDVAEKAGVAYNGDGKEMSGMGVAVGDYDHDGRMDLFITTFANDNYVLFHNDGGGFFTDVSYPSGVGEPTVAYLGWATFFFDYDNDGHLDLFCVNGHVYPEVDGAIKESYRQPLQLLRNLGSGKFHEVSVEAGLRALAPQSARGGSFADFDNDGDLDVLVSVMDGKPMLLENVNGNRANWLRVELTGEKCNRMAVGARVKVTARGLMQYASMRAGESYLSSSDPRLHFGLGSAPEADIEVTWPGGGTERITGLKANQAVHIRQGRGLQRR